MVENAAVGAKRYDELGFNYRVARNVGEVTMADFIGLIHESLTGGCTVFLGEVLLLRQVDEELSRFKIHYPGFDASEHS